MPKTVGIIENATVSPPGRMPHPQQVLRHATVRFNPISPAALSRYSLLATVEAIFNLGTLGRNDTSATPISDPFRGGIP